MTPLPVPENTARLIGWRGDLTDGQRREVIEYLAGHSDPVVLTALAAGIAAAMVVPEPDCAMWRKVSGLPWETDPELGARDELSALARRLRFRDAQNGVTAEYLVLPLGEEPGQAGAE